eukprot:3344470-Amphidinium_carterae.1
MTLGIRRCPGCQALIQKQGDGLITGCDKMTCRCGCMFCFKCGMPAGAQGTPGKRLQAIRLKQNFDMIVISL